MIVDLKFNTENSTFYYKEYEIYTWYNGYEGDIMYSVINKNSDDEIDFILLSSAIRYIDEIED